MNIRVGFQDRVGGRAVFEAAEDGMNYEWVHRDRWTEFTDDQLAEMIRSARGSFDRMRAATAKVNQCQPSAGAWETA